MSGSAVRSLSVMAATVVMLGVVAARACQAQGYPFSQRASVAQTIAFTHVTVEYGRPVARGRTLFGDSALVKWNAIWHPGADSATRITFDHDLKLEGRDVPAGEYSVWLIPRGTGPWTLILNRAAHVFHQPYPGESTELFRVDVTPERGDHMETLGFYFPVVLRDTAVMRIHWGQVMLPIRLQAPYRPQ